MRCNVDRNKKDRSFDQQYKSIEQLIREAYGLSPDQMGSGQDGEKAKMQRKHFFLFLCALPELQQPA